MPTFRVTAKMSLGGSNGIAKGTTVQVVTPNGINSVDANKIRLLSNSNLAKTFPHLHAMLRISRW